MHLMAKMVSMYINSNALLVAYCRFSILLLLRALENFDTFFLLFFAYVHDDNVKVGVKVEVS